MSQQLTDVVGIARCVHGLRMEEHSHRRGGTPAFAAYILGRESVLFELMNPELLCVNPYIKGSTLANEWAKGRLHEKTELRAVVRYAQS